MDYHILPFYMAYPNWKNEFKFDSKEDKVRRDLEYLQQMYPKEAKQCQKRIHEIIDKIDYDGSMIYDEYPDRYQLHELAERIIEILKKEELNVDEEKWQIKSEMIEILLFYDVYSRRHIRKQKYLRF